MPYGDGRPAPLRSFPKVAHTDGALGRAVEAKELAQRRNPFVQGDRVKVPDGAIGLVRHVEGFSCVVELLGRPAFQRFHVLQLKAAA